MKFILPYLRVAFWFVCIITFLIGVLIAVNPTVKIFLIILTLISVIAEFVQVYHELSKNI